MEGRLLCKAWRNKMAAQQQFRFCVAIREKFSRFPDCTRTLEMACFRRELYTSAVFLRPFSCRSQHNHLTKREPNPKWLRVALGSEVTCPRRQAKSRCSVAETAFVGVTHSRRILSRTPAAPHIVQLVGTSRLSSFADWKDLRHWCRTGSVRCYSDNSRESNDKMRQQIKGAVVFIPNPITWIQTKWNLLQLRYKFDRDFSEEEFLHGATHAICHIMHMLSHGQFEQLGELVTDELIVWFRKFICTLSRSESRALELYEQDIVLNKVRFISIEDVCEKSLAYVDVVYFALKVVDNTPYLVDMGFRFRRDYKPDPPGYWELAGVTHVRVQNLAGD